jgi:hypothetical protein
VVENKGAAGIDEMPVSELKDWLVVHWPSVKKALLEGRYLPQPVRRVDIPKPSVDIDRRMRNRTSGGVRGPRGNPAPYSMGARATP